MRTALDVRVFYGMMPDERQQGVGFGVLFRWDISLLDGYAWQVLPNSARRPGLGRFFGIDTPTVRATLKEWQPDVVLLTGWQSWMLVQSLWASVRLGVPVLVRGESSIRAMRPAWKRLMHQLWMKFFDGFLVIGEANRRFYSQVGVSPERMFACPYFVENERFATVASQLVPKRNGIRKEWGIAPDDVCFLFAGKLIPKKCPLQVIDALLLALASNPRLHLLVVGTGELLPAAKQLVLERELPVTFAGFLNQSEIVRAYVAADCLVLPSDAGETWGLVVNEAMACGLPAIVSDRVGCGPDLVEQGVTGELFTFGDTAALAERMIGLSNDPVRLRALGAAARDRVMRGYSVERAVAGTLAAVRWAAARRR